MDMTEPLTTFRIRAYYVSELAQLYNPHLSAQGATRQLRRWIEYNQQLSKELDQLGYLSGQRCYTPKQVASIISYLGEP